MTKRASSASSQLLCCCGSAVLAASVDSELSLDLNCPQGKLIDVRVMLLTLTFAGLDLVKAKKSPGGINFFKSKLKK